MKKSKQITIKSHVGQNLIPPSTGTAIAFCLGFLFFALSGGAGAGNIPYRAVHLGGNWGTNINSFNELPTDYIEYLHSLNVNWVGISVSLHIDDSMDSTVELKYSDVQIPTFTDEVLVGAIRGLQQEGFNVYLTLAFETFEAEAADHPVPRWALGDPLMHDESPNIDPAYWPWRIDHPNHEDFVSEFFQTYTDQAVHFANIAETERVKLYSLGTETERLFRTRSGGRWPNDFGEELSSMVSAVREVYGGLLTYDMHYTALTVNFLYGPGSNHLWEDLGLDVVGLSMYPRLTGSYPQGVLPVSYFENQWENFFQNFLIPLKNNNPNRPILFTEFGYTDSVESPFEPNAQEFSHRLFVDENDNELDDGQEQQANIYEALFKVIDEHPDIVEGAFLWGNMMASEEHWSEFFGQVRGFDIRDKLSEEVIRRVYGIAVPDNDYDGDGLTNAQESQDLDPITPGVQNPFDPAISDSTGDLGSPNPDGVLDGLNDWDGDGMSNAEEFQWGYNPLDGTDFGKMPAHNVFGLLLLALFLALVSVVALRWRA